MRGPCIRGRAPRLWGVAPAAAKPQVCTLGCCDSSPGPLPLGDVMQGVFGSRLTGLSVCDLKPRGWPAGPPSQSPPASPHSWAQASCWVPLSGLGFHRLPGPFSRRSQVSPLAGRILPVQDPVTSQKVGLPTLHQQALGIHPGALLPQDPWVEAEAEGRKGRGESQRPCRGSPGAEACPGGCGVGPWVEGQRFCRGLTCSAPFFAPFFADLSTSFSIRMPEAKICHCGKFRESSKERGLRSLR